MCEMSHPDGALCHPAAKPLAHKLVNLGSFHGFKLAKSQMLFCMTQMIVMNLTSLNGHFSWKLFHTE